MMFIHESRVFEQQIETKYKTPLFNRASGIYILVGFSEKVSPGRQIVPALG